MLALFLLFAQEVADKVKESFYMSQQFWEFFVVQLFTCIPIALGVYLNYRKSIKLEEKAITLETKADKLEKDVKQVEVKTEENTRITEDAANKSETAATRANEATTKAEQAVKTSADKQDKAALAINGQLEKLQDTLAQAKFAEGFLQGKKEMKAEIDAERAVSLAATLRERDMIAASAQSVQLAQPPPAAQVEVVNKEAIEVEVKKK